MKFFRKTDIMIVLGIVLVSIIIWGTYNFVFADSSGKAEIYYESKLVKTVALDTGVDKTFSIPQNEHVVFHLSKDGTISFEHSDCPDKICIKSGNLRMVGRTAACLPNKIILKIVPTKARGTDDLDMIVGK